MNVQPESPDSHDADPKGSAKKPAVDQRTLDRIFGEVVPENTKDDLESPGGGSFAADDWYRANRPPHHGG